MRSLRVGGRSLEPARAVAGLRTFFSVIRERRASPRPGPTRPRSESRADQNGGRCRSSKCLPLGTHRPLVANATLGFDRQQPDHHLAPFSYLCSQQPAARAPRNPLLRISNGRLSMSPACGRNAPPLSHPRARPRTSRTAAPVPRSQPRSLYKLPERAAPRVPGRSSRPCRPLGSRRQCHLPVLWLLAPVAPIAYCSPPPRCCRYWPTCSL